MKQELTLQERIAIFVETKRDFVLVPSHRFLDQHDIPREVTIEDDGDRDVEIITLEGDTDVSLKDIYHSSLCIILSNQLGFDIEKCDITMLKQTDELQHLEANLKIFGKNEWIPIKIENIIDNGLRL